MVSVAQPGSAPAVFVSAYDRRYLAEVAQLEREAQARGDIADAIAWGAMYEQLEAELFGAAR